jgi:DNA-binding CsgD family transcriptional regulator
VPDDVEALVAIGEIARAEYLTDQLEDRGRAHTRPLALATAARCRGLIAAARNDLSAAADHLAEALVIHERAGQPFEAGRTLLVAGMVQRRSKQKRSARDLLHRALKSFDDLDAPIWAARVRQELARIGGRVTSSELTESELRSAELAAAGSTNREIADMLFISVKTVEANLSRAYPKLGIRSRRELVAALRTPDTPGG